MARRTEGITNTSIRVPTALYDQIIACADEQHRSINGQIVTLLELGIAHTRRRGEGGVEPPALAARKRRDA
jgi:hypothetical protein